MVPCGCVNERDNGIFSLFGRWLFGSLSHSLLLVSCKWLVFAVVVVVVGAGDGDCLLLSMMIVDTTESHCLLSLLIWSWYNYHWSLCMGPKLNISYLLLLWLLLLTQLSFPTIHSFAIQTKLIEKLQVNKRESNEWWWRWWWWSGWRETKQNNNHKTTN